MIPIPTSDGAEASAELNTTQRDETTFALHWFYGHVNCDMRGHVYTSGSSEAVPTQKSLNPLKPDLTCPNPVPV